MSDGSSPEFGGEPWGGRPEPDLDAPVLRQPPCRRTCHARCEEQLRGHAEFLRCCHYNFVRPHRALKFGRETRTPAMQAGVVNTRLNWSDILLMAALLSSTSMIPTRAASRYDRPGSSAGGHRGSGVRYLDRGRDQDQTWTAGVRIAHHLHDVPTAALFLEGGMLRTFDEEGRPNRPFREAAGRPSKCRHSGDPSGRGPGRGAPSCDLD